tara:strand:- start:2636 stop:5311 length:2676 start_codon:yes stop_codon:yes gene_type:complete
MFANSSIIANKTYKVTYTVSGFVSGGVKVRINGAPDTDGLVRSANGTYTEYITSSSSVNGNFSLAAVVSFTGSIDNVSVKEYLGQEVVPDSGCGSWLWENQSTNLITQSETFNDATWNANTDVIIDKGYLAPDGTNNATKVTADGASPKVALFSSGTAPYAKSIYARTVSGTGTIYLGEGFPSGIAVLSNITEQWQRFEITTTLNNFYGADFRGASTLTEVIIWGAQLEEQSYATSYIPTSGTSVTRNQDVCTNGGSVSTINSTEGVLYAEIAALADDETNRVISLSDGTGSNVLKLFYKTASNSMQVQGFVGGSLQINRTRVLSDITQLTKIALRYKTNDFAWYINGVKVTTDTSTNTWTANTLNKLSFDDGNNALRFFGKTKALAVWKEALSDEELTLLTAPAPVAPTFTLDFDEIANQFTFSRASFGTIVNEQGLIETVSNIGPELVTGGDFSNPSDWNISGANLTISNGKGISTGSNFGAQFKQTILTINKNYKLTFDIVDYTSGAIGLTANYYGEQNTFSSVGTHTAYFTSLNQTELRLYSENFIGSIDNVSVKEYTEDDIPRIDYSTGEEAFLLEPQSTNLINYSEDFSSLNWNHMVSASIDPNVVVSPDGTQNASRLNFHQGSTTSRIEQQIIGQTTGSYTFSVWAKSATNGNVQFEMEIGSAGTGTVAKTATSDWQRFEITGSVSSGTVNLYPQIESYTSTNPSIYIWGAQFEKLPYATSYIPTSGTTVTRVGETCVNATPEINSEEGVLYFEGSALVEGGSSRHISLNDGTFNNYINLRYSADVGRFQAFLKSNGGALDSLSSSAKVQTDNNKIALVYKTSEFSMWLNGSKVSTTTPAAMPIGLDELDLGLAGANLFYGNTKDLQVFTEALSDYQLAQLTTI